MSNSFFGMLTIAFIVLKLTGYITWSWWWVTSLVWIPISVAFLTFIVVVVGVWIKQRK